MEYKNLKIKDWALEDRPREKLMAKGKTALSDAEILAILIGTGTKKETAVELSRKLLKKVGNNLNELGKFGLAELSSIKGIGEAKAISIMAALELGRRRKLSEIMQRSKISSSKDVYLVFQPLISDLPHEEFWILLLNRANKIIERRKISQGGVAGTIIDAKIILKYAIESLASSMILCHNHPSGNLNPSEADIKITEKLLNGGKFFDIQILDHIIIGDNAYFSFADENLIL